MKRYENRYIFSSEITRRQKRARHRMLSLLIVLVFLVFAFFLGNLLTTRNVVLEDVSAAARNPPQSAKVRNAAVFLFMSFRFLWLSCGRLYHKADGLCESENEFCV